MKCPECESIRYKCVYSVKRDNQRLRTYKCVCCGSKFRSKEVIIDVKTEDSNRYDDLSFTAAEAKFAIESLEKEVDELKKRMDAYDRLTK